MSDCAEIQRQLRASGVLDERSRTHLESCAACAAMAAARPRLPDPDPGSADGFDDPAQWDTLAEAIGRDRGAWARARALPTTLRLAVALAIALAVPVLVLVFAPRVDLGVVPPVRLALELGTVALLSAWLVVVTLRPLHRPLSSGTRAAALASGILAAMVIASLPPAHTDHVASLAGGGVDLVPRAIGCLAYGSLMALPVVVVLLVFAREPRSEIRARLLAVGAALVGFAAVGAHCPIVLNEHLWAGHVAVFVPLFAFAAWLGRRRMSSR